jgi:hypothetical protein
MRIFNRNGIYYLELSRGNKVSLKTSDRTAAEEKAKLISQPLETIRLIKQLEAERTRLMDKLGGPKSKLLKSDFNPRKRGFASEAELQEHVLPRLISDYGLCDVEQYRKSSSGVMDAVARAENKKVIIEFKMGALREEYLGQCMRYLGDPRISADELWLIGERLHPHEVRVFQQFPKIKLFCILKLAQKRKILQAHRWT